MIIIVAGGRDFTNYNKAAHWIKNAPWEPSEIVSGGARGADRQGEKYAEEHGIDLTIMPANWKRDGKAGGMIRNQRMAEYADALIALPGGRGTDNMKRCMQELRKPIYEPAKEANDAE